MQHKVESPHQLARRLAQNTWTRCVGLSLKSQLLLRLKVKERELKERKKAFGVHYMDLLDSGATTKELEVCVEGTRAQLAILASGLAEIKALIQKHEEDIQAKLIEDPTMVGPGSYRSVAKVTPVESAMKNNNAPVEEEWDVVEETTPQDSK